MKVYFGIIIVIFNLMLSGSSVFFSETREIEKATRKAFIQIEKTWRLSGEEQKEGIAKVYKESVPSIYFIPFADPYLPNEIVNRPQNITPDALADWFLKEQSLPQFMMYAKERGLNLLRDNIDEIKRLVKIDLISNIDEERQRALMYISEFKLNEFSQEVLDIFLNSEELENQAANTMRELQMYEAIEHLISKPDNPVKYSETLRSLQRKNKAHKSILALLESPDVEIRWRAAYALAESGDESLVPYFKKLIKDQNYEVRKQAVVIGFFLEDEAYEKVYNDLVSLLSDKDSSVRIELVCNFAWKKDKVCSEAMRDLLIDESLDEWTHSRIVQAMQTLSGTYFGYHIGSDGWKPTTENNQKAIKKFEEWITANKVNTAISEENQKQRQIPIIVKAEIKPNVIKAGETIPLTITVKNDLPSSIYHNTFSLKPNNWDGETFNVSIQDIHRDNNLRNLYYSRPTIKNSPNVISGVGRNEIKSGEKLEIQTDVRKWKLIDDWLPGKYKIIVKIENLVVDGYTQLSVVSDQIEFEIK